MYGGSRMGGISFSKSYPYIFIFSSKAGSQHGYKDAWESDDVFSYTGQGQEGDMKFVLGNLQLRDHLKLGKRVFLFTEDVRSHFKFAAEVELDDFDFFKGKDSKGTNRIAIKFFFKKKGVQLPHFDQELNSSLIQEPIPVIDNTIKIPDITEKKSLVTSRVGQGAYRKSILYRWHFKCAVTNYSNKDILIASHIVSWKDSNNEARMDVNNGILLSPTYDALFDQSLISFENSGKIILSDSLLQTNYELLGVTGAEKIKNLAVGNIPYLEKHREKL